MPSRLQEKVIPRRGVFVLRTVILRSRGQLRPSSDIMDVGSTFQDQYSDLFTEPTDTSDFLRVLQNFLTRNNIASIGNFRIRVESTINNSCTLMFTGEAHTVDSDDSPSPAAGNIWTSATLPTVPNDGVLLHKESPEPWTACNSSSASQPHTHHTQFLEAQQNIAFPPCGEAEADYHGSPKNYEMIQNSM